MRDTVITLSPEQHARFAQGHDQFMRPAGPRALPTLAGAGAVRSPVLAPWRDAPEFRLTVTVNGLDTLLASQAIGGQSYGRDEVLLNHEFVDAVDEEGGMFRLDLRKLHLVKLTADCAPAHWSA